MIYNINNLRIVQAKSVENISEENNYLLRGGPLNEIDKADQKKLVTKYNLKTVIDFRDKDEIKSLPNIKIAGVDYYNIQILDPHKSVQKNPMQFLQAYDDNDDLNFMQHLYHEFVSNAFSKASFKQFLEVVSKANGSVYFHCTAGKDRTGFASMLLLEILGASEAEIYEDYLKTNDFTNDNFQLILSKLKNIYDNQIEDDILKDLIGVKKDYLKTSRTIIFDKYPSVVAFIKEDLGVDIKTLEKIRQKYVV